MNLTSDTLDDIWCGVTVMAGGGGGDPETARRDIEQAAVLPVTVAPLAELVADATVITAFGVGSVGATESNRVTALETALSVFTGETGISPDAVMPVEVGAGTVAEACLAADALDVPIVDADHVGLRCAPDIQLETITLAGLDRTPLIAATADETCIIRSADRPTEIEERLRDLASERTWYVLGYPFTAAQLRGTIETGWTGRARELGRALRQQQLGNINGVTVLAEGTLMDADLEEIDGFTVGRLTVDAGAGRYDIYIKNENIMVLRDGKCVSAAPENITVIDTGQIRAVYNGAPPAPGTEVRVVEIAPSPLWDTAAGRDLFSPVQLGFTVEDSVVRYKDIKKWEH
ncbi:MAG: DUF917 family protein [Candidatus Nanohaloarchaea archaeon]|nr:DUF917 family protein [Candidatus Nanohaloarchaea archaeon]